VTLRQPLWMELGSYSATQDRQALAALFSQPGVIGPTDLEVVQRGAGANMSVDVAAGSCVVGGTTAALQGNYLCQSDAVANVVIAASPSLGNSRIDLIVAQVRDQDIDLGTHNDWELIAVTGTPAATGTQVAPALPASSVLLATIAVGPLAATIVTANITDNRVLTGSAHPLAVLTSNGTVTPANPVPSWSSSVLLNGMTVVSGALVVPIGGLYRISASHASAPQATGTTLIGVRVNLGGVVSPVASGNFPSTASTAVATGSLPMAITAGASLSIYADYTPTAGGSGTTAPLIVTVEHIA
jgi:hypothetical protein